MKGLVLESLSLASDEAVIRSLFQVFIIILYSNTQILINFLVRSSIPPEVPLLPNVLAPKISVQPFHFETFFFSDMKG